MFFGDGFAEAELLTGDMVQENLFDSGKLKINLVFNFDLWSTHCIGPLDAPINILKVKQTKGPQL